MSEPTPVSLEYVAELLGLPERELVRAFEALERNEPGEAVYYARTALIALREVMFIADPRIRAERAAGA